MYFIASRDLKTTLEMAFKKEIEAWFALKDLDNPSEWTVVKKK